MAAYAALTRSAGAAARMASAISRLDTRPMPTAQHIVAGKRRLPFLLRIAVPPSLASNTGSAFQPAYYRRLQPGSLSERRNAGGGRSRVRTREQIKINDDTSKSRK